MIKILKLNNGEEVAGEYVSSKNDEIILKLPMSIIYRFHPMSSFPSIKLVRYMLFSKEHLFHFDKLNVVNVTDARSSFEDYYHHVLEFLGESADHNIDQELKNAIETDKNLKNRVYENILEQMPTPKNAN